MQQRVDHGGDRYQTADEEWEELAERSKERVVLQALIDFVDYIGVWEQGWHDDAPHDWEQDEEAEGENAFSLLLIETREIGLKSLSQKVERSTVQEDKHTVSN